MGFTIIEAGRKYQAANTGNVMTPLGGCATGFTGFMNSNSGGSGAYDSYSSTLTTSADVPGSTWCFYVAAGFEGIVVASACFSAGSDGQVFWKSSSEVEMTPNTADLFPDHKVGDHGDTSAPPSGLPIHPFLNIASPDVTSSDLPPSSSVGYTVTNDGFKFPNGFGPGGFNMPVQYLDGLLLLYAITAASPAISGGFVTNGPDNDPGDNGTTGTITFPDESSPTSGAILITGVSWDNAAVNVATPSGWTNLSTYQHSGGSRDLCLAVFAKEVALSGTYPFTANFTGTVNFTMAMDAFLLVAAPVFLGVHLNSSI